MLRISVVDFLNARPLTWGLLHDPPPGVSVSRDLPSVCAAKLASGEADVGLIPSIEYQRIPGLKVVPGLGIAASSEVRSVLLVSDVSREKIGSVALDPASRTSAALTRILLKRVLRRDARVPRGRRVGGRPPDHRRPGAEDPPERPRRPGPRGGVAGVLRAPVRLRLLGRPRGRGDARGGRRPAALLRDGRAPVRPARPRGVGRVGPLRSRSSRTTCATPCTSSSTRAISRAWLSTTGSRPRKGSSRRRGRSHSRRRRDRGRRPGRPGSATDAGEVAALLVGLGLAARLRAARSPCRRSDEVAAPRDRTLPEAALEVYRTSLGNAHPPLFAVLLHSGRASRRPTGRCGFFRWRSARSISGPPRRWSRRLVGETAGLARARPARAAAVGRTGILRAPRVLAAPVHGRPPAALSAVWQRIARLDRRLAVFGVLALASHYAACSIRGRRVRLRGVPLRRGPAGLAGWPRPSRRQFSHSPAWPRGSSRRTCEPPRAARSRRRSGRPGSPSRTSPGAESVPPSSGARRCRSSATSFLDAAGPRRDSPCSSSRWPSSCAGVARPPRSCWPCRCCWRPTGGLASVYPYGGSRHSIDLALYVVGGCRLRARARHGRAAAGSRSSSPRRSRRRRFSPPARTSPRWSRPTRGHAA